VRVLVLGAAGTLGRPTLRSLVAEGHEVWGLTRRVIGARTIAAYQARPVIGDLLVSESMRGVLAKSQPQAVVALLSARPPRSPSRLREFRPTLRLWQEIPTLLELAAQHGVERLVFTSMSLTARTHSTR
jgi:nucleoside-diphosphate-sugar epimerase